MADTSTTQTPTQPTFPACMVKGHDHALILVREHTQDGTGQKAYTLECPTGRYRYFFIPEVFARVGSAVRMGRPRYGWKD